MHTKRPVAHLRGYPHPFPYSRAPPARSRATPWGEPDVTAADLEACGQAFDVPLPQAGRRLAEVIDVSWGLGEANKGEVGQVRIDAEPHGDPPIVGSVLGKRP
jgi:hypothetical protein